MSDISLKKLPPHNNDAERRTLGAMMLSPNAYYIAAGMLSAHDFYEPKHRHIFSALTTVYNQEERPDMVMLIDCLKKSHKLSNAGGYDYVVDILDCTPTAETIKSTAKLVKDASTLRQLISWSNSVYESAYNNGYSADSIINEHEQRFFEIAISGKGYELNKDVLDSKAISDVALEEIYNNRGGVKKTGLLTRLDIFDSLTNGLPQLTILSASTGIGKTALALNIIKNIAIDGDIPALYINCEMDSEELIYRLVGMVGRLAITEKLKNGKWDDIDKDKVEQAISDIYESSLTITDNHPKTINTIISLIYQHKLKSDIRVVVIDYLGEIEPDELSFKENSDYKTLGRWTQSLKYICAKLGIKLVLLAQLNREGDHSPTRDKVAGSWKISQKADLFCILYRKDEKYILKIDKNRHGPYPAKIELSYNKEMQLIEEKGFYADETTE